MGFHATVLGHPSPPFKGVLRAHSWAGGREKPGVQASKLFLELFLQRPASQAEENIPTIPAGNLLFFLFWKKVKYH